MRQDQSPQEEGGKGEHKTDSEDPENLKFSIPVCSKTKPKVTQEEKDVL